MSNFISRLTSDDDLKKRIYSVKSKTDDEKAISANRKDALDLKISGEEADGWRVVKRNIKSVRMAKPKPIDRQLEDDVWCLFYRMGFKEFNADRQFTIKVGESSPARQIDVFAKDDETIFIVECTHAQETASKSIKALVDKINGMRDDIFKVIHSHYGRSPRIKIKWAIATRNVEWRTADKARAEDSKISIITEDDIAYYTKLTAHLKEAARYQFFARYLKGEKVDGLRMEVAASRGKMGGVTFYNFLISPYDLLKIGYISHKATNSATDFETYQRLVKPSRLKKIARYIDAGGQFPTNVVINFKTKDLSFKKIESFGDTTLGKLTLPGLYGSAWVIDGQHRLYGFAYSERNNGKRSNVIPVLAYENLPLTQEMNLFIDINCEQVKVPRGLLNEIYSNLNYDASDLEDRLEAQCARIALSLNKIPTSPIRDRISTESKGRDNYRCLTLTSLVDGIEENKFLGTTTEQAIIAGPLTHRSAKIELSTEKALDVLVGYFNIFAESLPLHWQLGNAKGGFLCTNNGLRALLRLLRELIAFAENQESVRAHNLEAEKVIGLVAPYVEPLIEFFKTAEPMEIQAYRSRQALDGVSKNCLGLMGIISDAIPGFATVELREYLSTRDKEGTKLASGLIDEINHILYEDVTSRLKQNYGVERDNWWWKGVPQSIREKCDSQVNRDNGEKERWQYLSLADYPGIATHSWALFQTEYELGEKGKKGQKVGWISKLCKIRQTTHHPEKGLLSKEDVVFVKTMHGLVKERIAGFGTTDARQRQKADSEIL